MIEIGETTKIERFREKPTDAVGLRDAPGYVLASMGNYVFDTEMLRSIVTADAHDEGSAHDIGGDLFPSSSSRATRTSTTSRPTKCREKPIVTGTTGVTSERSTRTSTRTWTWSRRSPSSTSTTIAGPSTR